MKILAILAVLATGTVFGNNNIDRGITELLSWEDPKKADQLSDYLQVSLMASPFVYSAFKTDRWHYLKITGVVTSINYGLTAIIKRVTLRERPNKQNFFSFPSGHTSGAFLASGLLCKFEKKTCVPGLISASLVGVLRISARKHWFSDVFIGAYMGYMNGTYLPTLVFGF